MVKNDTEGTRAAQRIIRLSYPTKQAVITLKANDFYLCETFAEHVYESNRKEYLKRKQNDPVKIKRQIITGKLGELAVYYYLTRYSSKHCTAPDMAVYSTGKSFDADLRHNGHHIHVKSVLVNSANQHGLAWLMQKKDPLFYMSARSSHYLALCQVVDKFTVHFYGFLPVDDAIIGEPKVEALREGKFALWWHEQRPGKIVWF